MGSLEVNEIIQPCPGSSGRSQVVLEAGVFEDLAELLDRLVDRAARNARAAGDLGDGFRLEAPAQIAQFAWESFEDGSHVDSQRAQLIRGPRLGPGAQEVILLIESLRPLDRAAIFVLETVVQGTAAAPVVPDTGLLRFDEGSELCARPPGR